MLGKTNRDAGFGAVGLIIIVLCLLVLGLIGWRVYEANRSQQSTTNTPNQTKKVPDPTPEAVDPNVGYVVIKEWGVRFRPVKGLDDVIYSADGDKQAMIFSTAALSKYGENCGADSTSHAPLGRLYRTHGDKDDALRLSTLYAAQVGEYYYQLTGPQSVCSVDSSASELQTESLSLIKQSMQSLEAAK